MRGGEPAVRGIDLRKLLSETPIFFSLLTSVARARVRIGLSLLKKTDRRRRKRDWSPLPNQRARCAFVPVRVQETSPLAPSSESITHAVLSRALHVVAPKSLRLFAEETRWQCPSSKTVSLTPLLPQTLLTIWCVDSKSMPSAHFRYCLPT